MEDLNRISVWRYKDAPLHLQAFSQHGGDEDWVALVPKGFKDRHYIGWLESGGPFGCCDVSIEETEYGFVYIGAHA